ncbi:MAG TPA: DUF222 domain-containing protein [Mycobacteriales bacterium]|nr:DUF222 domain-containing protein [Mycobacteriales bacterium]
MPNLLERHVEVVDSIVSADVSVLPDQVLLDGTIELDRQMRRLAAARASWVREIELRGCHVDEAAGTAASWLQARTNMSKHAAFEVRTLGRSSERLPVIAEALAAGDVSVEHVQILASATKGLDPERVAADEKMLTDLAREFDPRTFRILVTRWVAVAFPDRHERDTEKQYDSRWLRLAETINGMVSVHGVLDPETARPLLLAVDALAKKAGASDERTQGQRNADALADLARIAINADQLPVTGGSRPAVTVITREEHIRGTADETTPPTTYDDGTPLTQAQLDRTLCDARYARLVLDSLNEMLDLGRLTRDISPALRKWLHLADGRCRAGGCDKPAHATDAHHIRWWRHGGRTDRNNLVLLCSFHHYLVHDRGWDIEMDASRNVTLTSPEGLRTWTSRPRGPTQLAMS